jgi:hypothetical protein
MNIALWIVTGVLAAVFAYSGSVKSTMSRERLIATGQTGIALFPMRLVRFTAICELFAVIGLVLPWLTGIAPVLTPLAAIGLAVVMVGAASSHARLREPRSVSANLVLFALCVFVATERLTSL